MEKPFWKSFRGKSNRLTGRNRGNSLNIKKQLDPEFVRIALRESIRDSSGARHPTRDLDTHLRMAMNWLALAQDQTGNGGVSAGFGRQGWRPDYPETTGYIIPTFLDYFHVTGDSNLLNRARRMGEYELRVQTKEGAIPGGYAEPRSPCVFDTGQVILGWVALYHETKQMDYLQAAQAAGDWLRSIQAPNGSWPTHDHARSARAYHARVSWALVMLGQSSREARFIETACQQLDWTLSQQQPNGWFAQAELRGKAFPVTHTIAYTIRGLLESGAALKENRYVTAAGRAADALLGRQLDDGSLRGAFDSTWTDRVSWRCVTGCAQMSLNWLRLYELTNQEHYLQAAQKSNLFVSQTQDLEVNGPPRGAIKGAWPFYGSYERFAYPNWATKFYADALMLERKLTRGKS